MTDRCKTIESQVRQFLDKIANDTLKTGMIFSKANLIQPQIMMRTHSNPKEFQILTIADEESYDLADENIYHINSIHTSWGGDIEYVPNTRWKELRNITGQSRPCYMTIFGNKAYLSGIPTIADDEITVWAFQKNVMMKIDSKGETDPETPAHTDLALIYGICMMFNRKEFKDDFEEQIELLNRKNGITKNGLQVGSKW